MRIFILLLTLVSTTLFAASDDGSPGLEQRDIEALRDWINTKRQVTVKALAQWRGACRASIDE